MAAPLLPNRILQYASTITDTVIVGFSRGKESMVCLDMCCRTFKKVYAFHQHIIRGLRFIEEGLNYFERRYGIEIMRVPYFTLEPMHRNGTYQMSSAYANEKLRRQIKIGDIEALVRKRTGARWLCYGHKVCDSLERRGMLAGFKFGGVDEKGGRFYPLAHYSHAGVYNHLKANNIPAPPDYRMFGGRQNFQDIDPDSLAALKRWYPDDYAKIVRLFPLVETRAKRVELFGRGTGVAGGKPPAGAKNGRWVGDKASYNTLHRRVEDARGKAKACEECGTTDPGLVYEWANLTGRYEDVSDYKRMCRSCHCRYDQKARNLGVKENADGEGGSASGRGKVQWRKSRTDPGEELHPATDAAVAAQPASAESPDH